MPVNGLEVLTVRRQHCRKEEALVAQVLHDRVGDRDSIGTRVDATSETVDVYFGKYHRGLVRTRSGAGFRLRLGCFAGDRRDLSALGLLLGPVILEEGLIHGVRSLGAVLDGVIIRAFRVQAQR